MLDHDTDSYYKISGTFLGGPPSGNLTREHILDNVTLYWLTGTGVSAARSYWETAQVPAGPTPPPVALPVAFSAFPGEIFQAPRSWVQNSYPTLMYTTSPTGVATSPPGRSPSCSPARFALRSGHSASSSGARPAHDLLQRLDAATDLTA